VRKEITMSMAWITEMRNFMDYDIQLTHYDPRWHPFLAMPTSARSYADGETITFPKPTELFNPMFAACSDFVVPWSSYGHLHIQGPGGGIRVVVAPIDQNSGDFLRMFDDHDQQLLQIELGPRGGAWVSASWDFHLVFDTRNGGEVRWIAWDVNAMGIKFAQIGSRVLEAGAKFLAQKLGLAL
jgi:hypothetical protein